MQRVFLIALSLLTCAAHAQTIDLQEKKATVLLNNISLEEAITIISISYGVQISYSDDVVPSEAVVNLRIEDETLHSALEKIFKPYGITYKVVKGNRYVLQKIKHVLTQTLRGTVTDLGTRAPVPGATVAIVVGGQQKGATTNDQGHFKIENVPLGRISLNVSSIGYDTRTIDGILLNSGKEFVLEVALSESVTPMNEVVVTGLKNDGIPGDGVAVTSSRSFSVEESKRYAGSLGDPARMASSYAGVTSASDENNALIVRGNSPRGVLWKVEGIEMPNPNHFATEGASSGVVSVLSSNMISSADFMTGAFPAQYGNALSAIFDISFRNGNNEKPEHSFQAGLTGLEVSTEGPFSKKSNSSYLVNYRYSTLSVLDKLSVDLNSAGQYKDYQDIAFKLNFPAGKAGSISLFGIGGKSKSSLNDTTVLDTNISNVGLVGLSYKKLINEKTFLQSSLSYSGTLISNQKEVSGFSSGTFAAEESYSKSYTRALLSVRRRITNRYYIEGGVIISHLRYNFFLKTVNPDNTSYPVVVNFSEQEKGDTYTAQGFLYARQYFSQKLFGFYGFHFLRFGLTKDYAFEPRVGLRWQATESSSLSLGYGKHSRVENLQYYLARDHQSGGNEVQINKNLGFTRADHIVLSFEQALAPNLRLKAETYYQQLYNAPVQTDPSQIYSTINEDTGFITDSLINNGRGKNYGFEISVDRSFSNNFYWMANGTVFKSQFAVDNQEYRNTAYDGNYSIHALCGKEFELSGKRSRIGINIKMTQAGGRRYVPIDLEKSIAEDRQVHNWDEAFEHKLPAYFRTDFQIVYRINRPRYAFEWRLDIQNVTNHRNAAWYYYDPAEETVKLKNQVGFVPLLSFRIDF